MANKRKLNTFSIEVKKQIIDEVEKKIKKKNEIAKEFGIPSSTLSTILKNKATILEKFEDGLGKRKKLKTCEFPDMEKCLMVWITQCRTQNIPLDGLVIKEKAESFAKELGYLNFKGSNGWFENFKKRNNITFLKMCGESASVDDEVCEEFRKKISLILKDYDEKDVFNADETGLFFKCTPDKTMHVKGEACHGGKRSKERITLLFCANMNGSEKLKPFMIGKSKNPRCFAGIKSFPLDYEANHKAWMTSKLFEDWLKNLNKKMKKEKRKIVLFIDNCPAHSTIPKMENVKIEFLPPNTTSKLQPLDQGIIQSFKVKYRHLVVKKMLSEMEDGVSQTSVNVLEAMRMTYKAWNSVLSSTIINSFKKAGFIKNHENIQTINVNDSAENCTDNDWIRLTGLMKLDNMEFNDFVAVDDAVTVCGLLDDKDIIAEMKVSSEVVEEDNEEISELPPSVTNKQALSAVDTLKRYVEHQPNMSEDTFKAIAHLECVIDKISCSSLKQTTMESFFPIHL